MNDISDEEFFKIINDFTPGDAPPEEQIAYEEKKLQKVEAIIAQFEEAKKNTPEDNLKFIEYCDKVIKQYTDELGETLLAIPSKESIIETMAQFEHLEIFKHLPVPKIYLEHKAQHDKKLKHELDNYNFVDLQVKTKDHKKRLENYKDFLQEKLQRNKLDARFKIKK